MICSRYGIQTHFKGNSTMKNLLVFPKDLACNHEYIGETSRTFGERFKEHLKEPSPIHHHSISTVHLTIQHNFQIIVREGHDIARTIKGSIYIGINNPTLSRNTGKFNVHYIWDRVFLNTSGLKNKKACVRYWAC